ncbi:hypothetical protein K488DRAFT_74576 [Vararia minispora EC-137]|uniref:Uncharacterized protein n=1 Tax=Vararia minispora EC-137 TaxID=1314806 RepID=A0ACB8Q712_9AGAM|nr:hypothetical protein K488DRAFT_74576 [Vararia minispora EC-137]
MSTSTETDGPSLRTSNAISALPQRADAAQMVVQDEGCPSLAMPFNMHTPGPNVPGAFLPEFEEGYGCLELEDLKLAANPQDTKVNDVLQGPDELRKVAQSVIQAAAQYLPSSVTSTISGFLSTTSASANDNTHTVSMPTQKEFGMRLGEKAGGAGALPGGVDESSVVAKVSDGPTASEGVGGTAASGPGASSTADVAGLAHLTVPAENPVTATSTRGVTAHHVNSGRAHANPNAADAGNGAAHVACRESSDKDLARQTHFHDVLRENPEVLDVTSVSWTDARDQAVQGSKATEGQNGIDPMVTQKLALVPAQTEMAAIASATQEQKDIAEGVNGATLTTGVGLFNEEEVKTQEPIPNDIHPTDAKSSTSATATTRIASTTSKSTMKRKSKLMDSVRGGMKIISGKLGGDKAKVEEGKRLKSGEL